MKIRNTFIIFIVSGFWHGANWTFVAWGALNAIFFLPLILTNSNRNHMQIVAKGRWLPTVKETFLMLLTFGLTVFAWIFFRAENISHAFTYISEIFSPSLLSLPEILPKTLMLLVVLFVFVEWIGRESQYAIEGISEIKFRGLRWSLYLFIVFLIGMFAMTEETPFIYFQF